MPRPPAWRLAALLAGACAGIDAAADELVFGSFRDADNAGRWAAELEQRFGQGFRVEPVWREDGEWFRVRSDGSSAAGRAALTTAAGDAGLEVWTLRGAAQRAHGVASPAPLPVAAAPAVSLSRTTSLSPGTRLSTAAAVSAVATGATMAAGGAAHGAEPQPQATVYADLDLGVQTRTYTERGANGQDRFQPSVSARFEYHRSWNDDRSSLTFTPFLRLDADDDERTHGDLRELFYSRVGDDWELHVGARQIFWGVTEFNHLVDVVNQTDFVENVDGEDKLGQPMVQLSLVRDWGIVDLFALTGFRERTFPGEDGRLRGLPMVSEDARYASGAGRHRVDGAIRWSHHVGPLSFGVHHFSGTGRDPRYLPELRDGELVLIPEYHVIDQTGFDGQALFGDWAWKLEALTRSGDGPRYQALAAGFERTLVGMLGSRGDLGVVVEYMYDERDEAAYNTLFEHDVAVGGRWRANDLANTTALLGLIWDVRTDEYVVSLEASRQLGASWQAVLEGRVFAGAEAIDPAAGLPALLDGDVKSRALQDDDYIQLELTRYF